MPKLEPLSIRSRLGKHPNVLGIAIPKEVVEFLTTPMIHYSRLNIKRIIHDAKLVDRLGFQ